jgi:hypothetical protein
VTYCQYRHDRAGPTLRGTGEQARKTQADSHTITAADPIPDHLRAALTKINNATRSAHQPDKVGTCLFTAGMGQGPHESSLTARIRRPAREV